jgi:hypothetical protein
MAANDVEVKMFEICAGKNYGRAGFTDEPAAPTGMWRRAYFVRKNLRLAHSERVIT